MQSFIVEKIEFDFTDSFGTITEQEQEFITDNALGVWHVEDEDQLLEHISNTTGCLLYTSPSPRDGLLSRMPSSA